ncbi:MAG: cytochrome P450 [Nocardioides sp.]
MPSVPTTSLDLTSAEVIADPYPFLAQERARHEVAWHESMERWLTFSHRAAGEVLRERRLGRIWRDREPASYWEPFNLLHRNQMMEHEPPDHARLRRPVAAAFHRGHVERLRPRVRVLASELLTALDLSGFDIIAEYAEPLPVLVIAELLGVPSRYASELRTWSQAIVRMYEPATIEADVAAALAAATDFAALVRELLAARRARPAGDLISDLAGTELSDDEVVAVVVLLLNAGHEASVNVFGNGLVAMLRRDLWPAPDAALTVEEMLRFDSALHLFERTATEPVTIAGIDIEPGQKIAALLGAANRDPAVFEHPDEFVADRNPNPHLAFGVGVHFCLGAPLARMELAESLGSLFSWCPSMRLAGEPTSRGTFVLRGYRRVPVSAVPR